MKNNNYLLLHRGSKAIMSFLDTSNHFRATLTAPYKIINLLHWGDPLQNSIYRSRKNRDGTRKNPTQTHTAQEIVRLSDPVGIESPKDVCKETSRSGKQYEVILCSPK